MMPVSFGAFQKKFRCLVLCTFSHGMSAFDPEHLSQVRAHTLIALSLCFVTDCFCSHTDLCAQHSTLNLWLQQGHNKHKTCSEQAGSKKYLIFYIGTFSAEFYRVLCVCLALSFIPLLSKTFSRERSN